MRRYFAAFILAALALTVTASSAFAAIAKPVVTKFSPAQVRVGQTLVITGKNFRKGGTNNKVYFRRASDGKTVRARAKKATTKRIEVVVPPTIDKFINVVNNVKQPTRFRLAIYTRTLGPYTKTSRSPFVLDANAVVGPNGGPVTTVPPPPADCDADGVTDADDSDDDNDLLTDETEQRIGTNICAKDTDADGVEDGYEYYSALDLNGNAMPYPGKRPYPNALDGTDAGHDFDGDGMTLTDEFAAWAAFGNRTVPLNYSDGSQYTGGAPAPAPGLEWMDLDNNGKLSDDEEDVDGDGLGNWVEMAKKEDTPANNKPGCSFASTTSPNTVYVQAASFTDCGGGLRPNGNTFVPIEGVSFREFPPNYLDPDSDGDGLNDSNDDQDHDGRSNFEEVVAGGDGYFSDPQEPCDPDPESATCERHNRGGAK
jgi:hypothetical protein